MNIVNESICEVINEMQKRLMAHGNGTAYCCLDAVFSGDNNPSLEGASSPMKQDDLR